MGPEQPGRRDPSELTGDTIASLSFDPESMIGDYTWQQLESLARSSEREASTLQAEIDALTIKKQDLEERARQYRSASEKAMPKPEED